MDSRKRRASHVCATAKERSRNHDRIRDLMAQGPRAARRLEACSSSRCRQRARECPLTRSGQVFEAASQRLKAGAARVACLRQDRRPCARLMMNSGPIRLKMGEDRAIIHLN